MGFTTSERRSTVVSATMAQGGCGCAGHSALPPLAWWSPQVMVGMVPQYEYVLLHGSAVLPDFGRHVHGPCAVGGCRRANVGLFSAHWDLCEAQEWVHCSLPCQSVTAGWNSGRRSQIDSQIHIWHSCQVDQSDLQHAQNVL